MSGSFALARVEQLQVFDRGPEGEGFATALGQQQDAELELLTAAARCRFPMSAPADALDLLGGQFLRARSPRETNDDVAYRARIREAFDFWGIATRLTGFVEAMKPYWATGYRPIWLNNWQAAIDGDPAWFSRTWGIWAGTFEPDTVWSSDPTETWGDGGLWGIFYDPADPYTAPSFGVADLTWVRREIRLIKGAQAYPVTVALGLALDETGSSPIWGDGGTWGDGGLWGSPDPSAVVYLKLMPIWSEEDIGGGTAAWGTPGDTWGT